MNFGKRLHIAIEKCSLSVPQVARATEVPIPTINALIRRDSKRTEYMESLIACLNPTKVNVEWVRTGVGSPEPIGIPAKLASNDAHLLSAGTSAMIRVPRIAVARAGDLVRIVTLEGETVDVSTGWLHGNVSGRAAGLSWSEQTDNTMQGLINRGDRYLIDASQQAVHSGAIYSVAVDGQEMTRALDATAGEELAIYSINPDGSRKTEHFHKAKVQIIGRVVFRWGPTPTMTFIQQ